MNEDLAAAEREAMVRALRTRDHRILRAMRTVPRHEFVPAEYRAIAYADEPVPLGSSEATASAPHMVAIMMEELDPHPGDRVLEIGGGMGYLAAVVAELVRPDGHVHTVELDPHLAREARRRLIENGYGSLVTVHAGDGARGLPELAPFHGIVVSCATPGLREEWKAQLKDGGRLVAPIGTGFEQQLVTFRKSGGSGSLSEGPRVRFVPLRRPT